MFKRFALAALLIVSLATTATAEVYKIDRSHSSIGFTVSHLALSKVKGNFGDYAGTIDYNAADLSQSTVEVTIQTASIDTKSEGRDRDLKSSNFFAADSFPVITFKSTKVTPKTDKTFDLTGDLTMHGVTKPVTLNVEMLGSMDDPMMGKRLAFTATTTINRQDWGINWSRTLDNGGLVAGNDIKLDIDIEAVIPKEKK